MVKTVDTLHIPLSTSMELLLLTEPVMENSNPANMVSQVHLVVQLMENVVLVQHSLVVLEEPSLVTNLVAVPLARSEASLQVR